MVWNQYFVRGLYGVMGADECASGYHIEGDTGNVLVCDSDRQWG